MKTNLHEKKTGITGHPFHSIAQQGQVISRHSAAFFYPSFHERGNEYFRVHWSVVVDDGVIQVVGDDNTTEWIWFKEDGTALYTKSGWGSPAYALHDALNHAFEKPEAVQRIEQSPIQ